VSDTGLLKLLSKLSVSVEVALCPPERVTELGWDAEIEKSVPVFNMTLILFDPIEAKSKNTMSGAWSPLMSATSANLTSLRLAPTG
jgi:hypothetical protein